MGTANGNSRQHLAAEPIAVIGMGCRLPGGVDSPEAYWRLLVDGHESTGEVPSERWAYYQNANPENALKLHHTTKSGSFLEDISGFDAEFFGISPREAGQMDPQQRLVLEVAWEALEHAGVVPAELAGGDTGVFVGVGTDDYGRRLLEDLPRVEAWTGIGASLCAVANRVSYTLDLRGPSLAVDTACSSSLVALHLACQSLRLGESPLSLVGGVMLMAAPGLTMVLDAAGAISPDGRSKAFDASADGYGRGEGCGVIVLKRLSDARRDGDRVLAVVRGSAVNQDGKTNGIMAPSREAQEHLFRRAYRDAGLSPDSVDYVEAHGTGTSTGDPIEAGAMASVFGAERAAERPCLIGSVKTNIGHLEAGSGVAGVIKTVLALRHSEIPPSLHFAQPNPSIPWHSSGLQVVTERVAWPSNGHPRRAGVSGYGYGGTIAHVVLEQAPQEDFNHQESGEHEGREAASSLETGTRPDAPRLYPVSGGNEEGVRANAQRLAEWLTGDGCAVPLEDLGHTLVHRRAHLGWRGSVVATDRAELATRLRRMATGEGGYGVTGPVPAMAESGTEPVWVFSGHGSQWVGMGRDMLPAEPAFRRVLDEIDGVFRAEIGFSPREVLVDGDLGGVDRIQPMIFAMQAALAEVWRSYGVQPAALIGHSVGEIAAAVAAGVLDLADGAQLVCRRSRLLRHVAGDGAMVMVDLPFAEVAERLTGRIDAVPAIAASPAATVVAGDVSAVDALVRRWGQEQVGVQRVNSDVAFHSRHMDPLLHDLRTALSDLDPRRPRVPLYTTALEDPRSQALRDGHYWAANLRNPVRFSAAISAALEDGYRVFVEVSSHPVVTQSINEVMINDGVDGVVAHTLRRGRPERAAFLANVGELHSHGVDVDLVAIQPDGGLADLPGGVWQHRRHWVDSPATPAGQTRQHDPASHTLLGSPTAINGASPVRLWQTYLDEQSRPYPGRHPVQDVEIVPAAVLINTFLAAAGQGAAEDPVSSLSDVSLRTPVAITPSRQLQVVHQDGSLKLCSRPLPDGGVEEDEVEANWLTHTTAVAIPHAGGHTVGRELNVEQLRDRCTQLLDAGFVIDRLASVGVAAMGFPWRIDELSRSDTELFAKVTAAPDGAQPGSWAALLDAATSAASVTFSGPPTLRMPAHIRHIAVTGTPPAQAVIHVRVVEDIDASGTVDFQVATLDGEVLAEASDLRYGTLEGGTHADTPPQHLVHELAWRPLQFPANADVVDTTAEELSLVVFVGADDELIGALAERFAQHGLPTLTVAAPENLDDLDGELDSSTAVVVAPLAVGGERAGVAGFQSAWLLTSVAQRLATREPRTRPSLWCLTRGVREARWDGALAQSPVWGVGRVVAGEHPELWGGIVDLDDHQPAVAAESLLRVLRHRPGEDVIALREDEISVARLVPTTSERVGEGFRCRPEGTYLVTGGLGVLGLEVARWLAERGARRLVLAGRRALPPRDLWDDVTDPSMASRIRSVRALEAGGVTVRTLALDISDRRQAAKLLSAEELGLPPIRGIVHAAGTLDNRMVADVDGPSLRKVMRPKAGGALVLHELFPPGSVDFLALFSSCGLLLGLPGQASYAAANAFLDALASHRRASGHSDTVSFGWTSWRGLGMSTSSELIDMELAARGTGDITASEAFRSWEYVERHDSSYVAVLRAIPPEPGTRRPPLLRDLPAVGRSESAAAPTALPWAGLEGDDLEEYVTREVTRQITAEMGLASDDLDHRKPLAEAGLDSVLTLVIRRRLEKHFRLSLPATLLWNKPTVTAISAYVQELLSGESLGLDAGGAAEDASSVNAVSNDIR